MRFLLGIVVGVLITVGTAYIHDSSATTSMSGPDGVASRMVNWEVVSRNVNDLSTNVRDDWDRLTKKLRADG
jgi:hypothetical protein